MSAYSNSRSRGYPLPASAARAAKGFPAGAGGLQGNNPSAAAAGGAPSASSCWRLHQQQMGEEQQVAAALQEVLGRACNKTCADCGTKHPRWAAVNLGFFICLECSGIHRKMGVHVSKVKSATLDRWSWQWVESVRSIGNDVAAAYYEYRLPKDYKKPQHGDDGTVLENWIRMKYERKCFAPKDKKEPWQILAEGGDPRIYLQQNTEAPPEGKKVKEKEKKKKKETTRDEPDNTAVNSPRDKRRENTKDAESTGKSVAAAAASLSALVDDFASLGVGDLTASFSSQTAAEAASSAVPGGGVACLSSSGAGSTSSSSSGAAAAAATSPPLSEADKKVAVAKAAIAALFNNNNSLQSSIGGMTHGAYMQQAAVSGSEPVAMNGSKMNGLFSTDNSAAGFSSFSCDPSYFSSSALYQSSAAGSAGNTAPSVLSRPSPSASAATAFDSAFASAPLQQQPHAGEAAARGTCGGSFWPAATPAAEMLSSTSSMNSGTAAAATTAASPYTNAGAAASPAWVASWPAAATANTVAAVPAAATDARPPPQQQQQSTFASLFSNTSSTNTSTAAAMSGATPGQAFPSWATLPAATAAPPSSSAQQQQQWPTSSSSSSSASTGLSMPSCGITPWDIATSNSNSNNTESASSSCALNSLDAFALAGKVQPRPQQQKGETQKQQQQQQKTERNANTPDMWQSAAPPSPPKPKEATEELLLI